MLFGIFLVGAGIVLITVDLCLKKVALEPLDS